MANARKNDDEAERIAREEYITRIKKALKAAKDKVHNSDKRYTRTA